MVEVPLEKVVLHSGRSFCAEHYANAYFTAPLHMHTEYELILIEEGTGLSLVGDSVLKLTPGDFMLIGQYLPHLWLSGDEYYEKGTPLLSRSVYAQFGPEVFPAGGGQVTEMAAIDTMLVASARGLYFHRDANLARAMERFRLLPDLSGAERLILLYEILNTLTACRDRFMTGENYPNKAGKYEGEAVIERVINYMNVNFQEGISLAGIASAAGMNTTALCRCFKRVTGRTIFGYILERRIAFAVELLTNSRISVKKIAYDCGYNNVSLFNKQFKRIKGITPVRYRELYNAKIPEEGVSR